MSQQSGNPNPFQQPSVFHQDDSGVTSTLSYEGLDKVAINNLALGLTFPYDVIQSFGKSRIEIHYPFDFINSTPQTEVLGLWEFFDQKVEKDFLTADMPFGSQGGIITSFGYPVELVGPIDAGDAYLIRIAQQLSAQGIVINEAWFFAPTDALGNPLAYPNGDEVPNAVNTHGCLTILQLLLRGQTSFPVFAPVLRFTQTVTSEYAIQASLLNARRIISTGTLPTLESIPNGLLFSLPNDSNPPVQNILGPGDLVYGWFKVFPTVRQIARLKWNIVQEWQYGLWPVAIYGELL